jgi:hypothetical protein
MTPPQFSLGLESIEVIILQRNSKKCFLCSEVSIEGDLQVTFGSLRE